MSNSSATVGVPVGSGIRIDLTMIVGLVMAALLALAIGYALASNDEGEVVVSSSNSVDYAIRHPDVRASVESTTNVDYGIRHLSVPVAPDLSRSVDFGTRHLAVTVTEDMSRSVDYALRHLAND